MQVLNFRLLWQRPGGNVGNLPKIPFISNSCISYFGHAFLKINLGLICLLPRKMRNTKKTHAILVSGHIMDIPSIQNK